MKKYNIPILNEEYYVNVFIGKRKEIIKAARIYTHEKELELDIILGRGLAFDCFRDKQSKHPLIIIDGDLPKIVLIATLAHEASHAVDYIADFIRLDDRSGEFRGHGIAAVLRGVLKGKLK